MSDNEFKHLHPNTRLIATQDKEERVNWIKSKLPWIEYAAATQIQNRLWDVFTQPRSRRMENILLFGESGTGKTTLAVDFMKKNNPKDSKTVASSKMLSKQHPIIEVLMPPEPDHMDLYRGILKAVDIPYLEPSRWKLIGIQDAVRELLKKSATQLLLIDEINNLLVGTASQQRLFLQHLRYISNDLGIALVCIGTPEARHALHSDAQLRRRFEEVELPRWEDEDALRDFVNRYVQALPLQQPSPVDSEVLRQFMISQSKGITYYICKAINRAAIVAIRTGREMIDLDSFQEDDVWGKSHITHIMGNPPYQERR